MKRELLAACITLAVVVSFVGLVGAQGQASSQSASTNGTPMKVQHGDRNGQASGVSPTTGSGKPYANKPEGGGKSVASPHASQQMNLESNRQLRAILERMDAISNHVASVGTQFEDLQGKLATHIPPQSSLVPAWIAAAAGLLAVGMICFAILILLGIRRQNKDMRDAVRQNGEDANEVKTGISAVQTSVADLPKTLQIQLKQLMDAVQKIDGKVGKFERATSDIPRQFDDVAKKISRDAESNRGSILSWLFGRGKTQAPDNGVTQQIEDRIGRLQVELLTAVESDKKLQSRKLELDERERRLNQRANDIDASCARAREEGAAAAERRAASLEAANKVLAESLSGKSEEFGKRVGTLEGEMNVAKAAAQQAKSECAMAKSQAAVAVKEREKLLEEVSRLSSEIEKRDQARENEIASAREEIKSTVEKANAEEMANLRAEAKIARDERDGAKRTAADLQAQKTAVDAALAAAKSSLDAEKSAHENDRITAEHELAAEKAARELDRQKADEKLAKIEHERDFAVSRVFPAEFNGDPDFQPLLSMLDDWDAHDVPGSALARASLSIFSDRKSLPPKIWQRALGDLSLGLATAMNAEKKSPTETADVLGKWKIAVQKCAADGPSFSLNLPAIGTQIDTSWMYTKSGAAKVSRIWSWAVYGQSGNVYMAEVE